MSAPIRQDKFGRNVMAHCETCACYLAPAAKYPRGECHAAPPVVVVDSTRLVSTQWPQVAPNQYCLSWRAE